MSVVCFLEHFELLKGIQILLKKTGRIPNRIFQVYFESGGVIEHGTLLHTGHLPIRIRAQIFGILPSARRI